MTLWFSVPGKVCVLPVTSEKDSVRGVTLVPRTGRCGNTENWGS